MAVTDNRGYPIVEATEPAASVSVPKLVALAEALDTDIQGLLDAVAALPTSGEVDTAIAAAITALKNGVGSALDTLEELAAAIGDDPDFIGTLTAALATKADGSTVTALAARVSKIDSAAPSIEMLWRMSHGL